MSAPLDAKQGDGEQEEERGGESFMQSEEVRPARCRVAPTRAFPRDLKGGSFEKNMKTRMAGAEIPCIPSNKK